eukprot:m.111577 g.111577  ORF g.111577 m.111577 type:complete len:268 (+) comp15387_c0_seq6:145-948(+)
MFNLDQLDRLDELLLRSYRDQILNLLQSSESPTDTYPFTILAGDIVDSNPDLWPLLRNHPRMFCTALSSVIIESQRDIKHEHPLEDQMSVKSPVTVRVAAHNENFHWTKVPGTEIMGQLCFFAGTVIRVGAVKMLELQREYACNKCDHVFTAHAEFELGYAIPKPTRCPNEVGDGCDSNKFKQVSEMDPRYCCDYQELKVQQRMSTLEFGSIPKAVHVVLAVDLDDLWMIAEMICGLLRGTCTDPPLGCSMSLLTHARQGTMLLSQP